MGIGSGWWKHPNEHALAAKGVRTALPEQIKVKKASRSSFNKLPNRIQNQIQRTSKVLKKLSITHPKYVHELSVVAVSRYKTLKNMVNSYTMERSLPSWTKKDWVGRENWNNNGHVYNLIKRLESATSSEEIEEVQNSLRRALELKG